MKQVDTRKELRQSIAAVEAEIGAHEQQIEALNLRLDGIRRAHELFESDQPAIIEMLRTIVTSGDSPGAITVFVPVRQAVSRRQPVRESKPSAHAPKNGRRKILATSVKRAARKTRPTEGLKRVDMIAEALRRHPEMSTRELVTALGHDFGWACTERNVTAHLYTNRRFQRAQTDHSGKKVVTWSLK